MFCWLTLQYIRDEVLHKIDRENKFCIILGDFNLDFPKLDSHPDTEGF